MKELSIEEIVTAADRLGFAVVPKIHLQRTTEAFERATQAIGGSLQRIEEVFEVLTELNLLLQSEDSASARLAKEIISRHFPDHYK